MESRWPAIGRRLIFYPYPPVFRPEPQSNYSIADHTYYFFKERGPPLTLKKIWDDKTIVALGLWSKKMER